VARAHINAGRSLHLSGAVAGAVPRLREGLDLAREIEFPHLVGYAANYLLAALLDTETPDVTEMERVHDVALSAARASAMANVEIECSSLGARVALLRDASEEAERRSHRAVSLLEAGRHIDGADEGVLWTHAGIVAGKDPGEASRFRRLARERVEEKASRFTDPRLREGYLRHPVTAIILAG
jgi:hypothetical protein